MKTKIITVFVVLAVLPFVPAVAHADEPELTVPPETQAQSENKGTGTQRKEHIDEIVVTATRLKTSEREVGSSVTVITADQIRQQQKITVLDVLKDVPALDVVQSGGPGTQASVFIRGAKSEHTLVLMDGVEMNDPSSAGRSFDFADLMVGNIERIEIVRGPQSTLYGSDAMGGVINIITKKGTGKPSGFVSAEGGSFKTFTERAGISGGTGLINYSFGISRLDTDGISAADEKDGNREKDGYENTTFSTRLGITPAKNFDADLILRYINTEADIDNSGGAGGDDPNNTADTKQLFLRTQARLSLFDDLWEQKLGFSLSDHSRDYRNDIDADHPSDLDRSSYDGQILKFDWQHNLYLHESNTLTLGIETEKEKAKSSYYSESAYGPYTSTFAEENARTSGYYLQDQIKTWNDWFTTLGIRLDDHSDFGTKTTYRLASSYLIRQTSTRLKGSYGTGFKAPSLYQLFSLYGDQDLEPEKGTGWDAGVEQIFYHELITLGITYFKNDFDDLIDFDSGTSKYVNVAKAETKGVETYLSARPSDDLTLRVSYTYTDTKDKDTGEKLLRRPKNKASFDANYRFLGKGNTNLEVLYVGKRDDYDYSSWPAARVTLGGYTLVNLAASYDVTRNIQVTGRVNNLFDKYYQEVFGYGTPGISGYAGIKCSF
jgi:vitamin B12 transporter